MAIKGSRHVSWTSRHLSQLKTPWWSSFLNRALALLQEWNFSDAQAIPRVAPATSGMDFFGCESKYHHDAPASGSARRESTRSRVVLVLGLKRAVVERPRRTDASFRCQHFLICLAADASVKFLRSWCVPTSSYSDVGLVCEAGFHPDIGRLQTYPTFLMVPKMPYLRSLSPREVSESFRLNENFFSGVVFFDFCAEKDSFPNTIGGPSRGVLIVADLKQLPNSLDTSPRRSALQTSRRIHSVNPITTTTYATRKNEQKNITLFFARKSRHLTTTHLNKSKNTDLTP